MSLEPSRPTRPDPSFFLPLIVLTGLWVRLWLAWDFYGTFDVGSWERLFDNWRTGASPYDEARRYSYSPVWFWVLSAFSRLNSWAGLPAAFVVKLPLILADAAVLFVLLRLARLLGQDPRQRAWTAAAFFLNPVSILNTGYHGQFDNLMVLFVLLACYFHLSAGVRAKPLSWVSFLISAAVKHSSLLLAPVFAFGQKTPMRQALFLLAAPALFLLCVSVYLLAGDPHVFQNVFLDTSSLRIVPGSWGWSMPARYLLFFLAGIDLQSDPRYAFLHSFNYGLYPLLIMAAAWLARRCALPDALRVYLLLFYTFTIQMAPQYTVWILPFAALTRGRFFYAYSVVTAAHLIAFYLWHDLVRIGFSAEARSVGFWIACFRTAGWLVTAAWLTQEIRKRLKQA